MGILTGGKIPPRHVTQRIKSHLHIFQQTKSVMRGNVSCESEIIFNNIVFECKFGWCRTMRKAPGRNTRKAYNKFIINLRIYRCNFRHSRAVQFPNFHIRRGNYNSSQHHSSITGACFE